MEINKINKNRIHVPFKASVKIELLLVFEGENLNSNKK